MPIKTKLDSLVPARERYSRKIKLLSGGLVNSTYFPGGEIVVYPWDTKVDEWFTANVRTESKTNILHRVLPKICDLKGCPLDSFVASEALIIVMVARSILKDNVLEIGHKCPSCNADHTDTIKIPDQLSKVGEKKQGWPGYDVITLPECEDVVHVRPLTVGDEASIESMPAKDRNLISDDAARVIAGLISVGGGTPDSPAEAITWFNALSPKDAAYLIDQFDKCQPTLSTVLDIACSKCSHAYTYRLKLDKDFFR